MCRAVYSKAVWTLALILLSLTACGLPPATPPTANLLPDSQVQPGVCEACDQATLAAALTQEKNNANNQAVATAEIVRANAQSTLSAAQTQDQNESDVIAAQLAATAEFERANAQATLSSAGSTQSAALTQDAIRQTQLADMATTGAESIVVQQNKDELAASTQTAVANTIATQARQDETQRRAPITFLWMWCLPIFVVLLAGLFLWGYWRRLKIQQTNQRILESPVDQLPARVTEVADHQHDDSLPYIESDIIDIDAPYQPVKPDDQVRGWLEEVKGKLLSRDKEDEDDSPNN